MRAIIPSKTAMKTALVATVGAATLMASAGVAQATTYYGPAKACRGYTSPGTYPESIQLNPCFDSTEENGRWFFTAVAVNSPFTAIEVHSQVGWKKRNADGSIPPGEPYWGGRDVKWGDIQGVYGPWYDVNENDGIGVDAGYCYYNRLWFIDGSTTYGPAESPGNCF
ncbi:hypothetical protein GCM10029978_076310 [Actinoallomurus acanthiterrae]